MIRPLTIHDLKSLESSAQFPMPNVNNPLYFYQIAVEDEKGLVGIALVKLTTEVSIILEDTERLRKTKALLEIFEAVEKAHEENKLDDTHVFLLNGSETERESFSRTLRRLGFVNATGIPMYYKVGTNQWLKANSKRLTRKRRISQQPQRSKLKPTSSEDPVAPSAQEG